MRLVYIIGNFFCNFHLEIDILFVLHQNVNKLKISFFDRNYLQKSLLFFKFYRHEWHDISHYLVNGNHLLDWPGKLLRTLKTAAYLINCRFYIL